MIVSGAGFTQFECRIKPGWVPRTTLSLEWRKLSSGNYYAVDRGAQSDVYEAEIALSGTFAQVSEFIDAVQANRVATLNANVIELSGFNDAEKIFGADIDYSTTVYATVLDIDNVTQRTLRGFGVKAILRAISPTFAATASMPSLRFVDVGYTADSEPTITKNDTYTGSMFYSDYRADAGRLELELLLENADAAALRRQVATVRGGNHTISGISGIAYPFGTRRGTTYPATCKILECVELGLFGLHYTKMRLVMAEVV